MLRQCYPAVMVRHLTQHRSGFPEGLTEITTFGDETGIALSVHRLAAGQKIEEVTEQDTAWLLMSGTVTFSVGDQTVTFARSSLFDEGPSCVHVSAEEVVKIESKTSAELTIYRTVNKKRFPPTFYRPEDVADEPRGRGVLQDASFRFVRTIFDGTNAHENSDLVLGEVITMPGRWSSYPPHHHPQPEIYHYRFTDPRGYGHAELGEQVLLVRQNDTVKILDNLDHAQCAAPGYGMYYSWVIRHLPNNRYDVPEFTADHTWLMDEGADFWWPKDV